MHFSSLDSRSRHHLEILGLGRDATREQIKERYHHLVKKTHPDKGGDGASFRAIQEAYALLSGAVGSGSTTMTPEEDFPWIFQHEKMHVVYERDSPDESSETWHPDLFRRTTCTSCMGSGLLPQILLDNRITYFSQTECSACEGRGSLIARRMSVEEMRDDEASANEPRVAKI